MFVEQDRGHQEARKVLREGQFNLKDRRSRSNSWSRSPHRSPSRHETVNTCWYNQCYGDRAQRCSQPCTYNRWPSQRDAATTSSWYHRHFGARAQNFTEPFVPHQQRNPTQRPCTSAVQPPASFHHRQVHPVNAGS
jgi:hypothetical protein